MSVQEPGHPAPYDTAFLADPRKNYAGSFEGENLSIPCYTPKQMKSLYPAGDYAVVAEYAPRGRAEVVTSLNYDGQDIPLVPAGASSRWAYKVVGYVATAEDEDAFVVLLKRVLGARLLTAALVAAAIAAALYLLFFWPKSPLLSPDLDPDAVGWMGETADEPDDPPEGIRLPGYKSITVRSGTRDVSVALHNPEKNECYLVMRLTLPATGETLFESKMVEPGKGFYNVTLSRPLSRGTYRAQLHYDAYDMVSLSRLNGAVINLDLVAE